MSGKQATYRWILSCVILIMLAALPCDNEALGNTVIVAGDAVVSPPGPDPSFDVIGGTTVEVQTGASVQAVGDDNGIETGAGYTATNSGEIDGNNNNAGAVVDIGNGLFIDGNGTLINNVNAVINGVTVSGPTTAGNGVLINGTGNINNSGEINGVSTSGISGGNGNGIYANNGLTLTNQSSGIVKGQMGDALAGGNYSGNGIDIPNATGNSTITNYGSITGSVGNNNSSFHGNGIVLISGGNANCNLLNYGTIEGSRTAGQTTCGNGVYFSVAFGTLQVTNYGRIISNLGYAIYKNDALTLTNETGGVIEGLYGVYSFGWGTDVITNSGTITGTGGNAIILDQGNDSLTLKTGTLITGSVDGGAQTDTITFDGEGTANFDVLNFEKLYKTGAGTWTINTDLTVNNSAQANLAISGGSLILNNTLTTTNGLLINAGGSLGGDTNITGNVTNNGTIKPGNSIGTINITGTYTQDANAVYEVELQGNGSGGPGVDNDFIDVTGNAVLAGTVRPLGTSLVRGRGDFTILRTTAGLGGTTFDILDFSSPALTLTLDYSTPNEVHLLSTRLLYSGFPGMTVNQEIIGETLDQAILDPTEDMEEVLLELDAVTISLSEFKNALDAISPEPFTSLPRFVFATNNTFTKVISKRLGQAGPRREVDQAGFTRLSKNNPVGPAGPDSEISGNNRLESEAWFEPFGYWEDQDSYHDHFGFNSETTGFMAGCDHAWDNFLLGVSVGYAKTNIDWREVSAEGEIENLSLSLYSSMVREKFYLDAAGIYNHQWYETQREINFGTLDREAAGDFDGDSFTLYFGGGTKLQFGNWDVTPNASFNYTYQKQDGFEETGADALNFKFEEQSYDSLESSVGISASFTTTTKNGFIIRPGVRASWVHEFLDNNEPIAARFNGGGDSFTLYGVAPDDNKAVVGAGIDMQFSDTISTSVDFDACFAHHYNAQALTAGFTVNF